MVTVVGLFGTVASTPVLHAKSARSCSVCEAQALPFGNKGKQDLEPKDTCSADGDSMQRPSARGLLS